MTSAALPVVEDLKVLEDRVAQLEACVPAFAVEELDLYPRSEGFHLAVVVAVADRSRGRNESRVKRSTCERPGRELRPVIAVDHDTVSLAVLGCDPESVHDEAGGL